MVRESAGAGIRGADEVLKRRVNNTGTGALVEKKNQAPEAGGSQNFPETKVNAPLSRRCPKSTFVPFSTFRGAYSGSKLFDS